MKTVTERRRRRGHPAGFGAAGGPPERRDTRSVGAAPSSPGGRVHPGRACSHGQTPFPRRRGLLESPAMNLLGAPVPLAALLALKDVSEDGSTDPGRTLMGAIGMLVIIALVIGIGQLMTGSSGSTR